MILRQSVEYVDFWGSGVGKFPQLKIAGRELLADVLISLG